MAVEIERDRNAGMTESFADNLRVDSRCEGQRRGRMAQVMKSDLGEPYLCDELTENDFDAFRVERFPVLGGEDIAGVRPRRAPSETFFELTTPVRDEHADDEFIEADRPAARSRLRFIFVHLIADAHAAATHRESAYVEIDVLPLQPGEFPSPHPGSQDQHPQGVEAVGAGRVEV